jgi:NTE family protein
VADGRVALVIAGAGARGAYEAGAVGALLPALERAGRSPRVLIGTSAGAINVVLLAAYADADPATAATELRRFWRTLRCHDVWRPLVVSAPATAARYTAQAVGLPRPRLHSLLDTRPLLATAQRWRWLVERAHDNVRRGLVDALAVVATDVYRGRTVVFVDLAEGIPLPPTDVPRAIDYVAGPLTVEHVLASAAIPLAFPAVPLDHPTAPTWYSDGGVRLNAPLKPAIALGAERLVVVATHPAEPVGGGLPAPVSRPEVDDQLVNVLEAVLIDRMIEDLWTLQKVNRALQQADGEGGGAAEARGGRRRGPETAAGGDGRWRGRRRGRWRRRPHPRWPPATVAGGAAPVRRPGPA